jgi:O-antigen/teichoic acid export membrane protein
MKAALPIGTSELTWASLWYLATVLLGLIAAGGAVGVFGAAHRVTMAVHTFVWLYFFNLLPSITRCVALPKSRYLDLMDGSITVSVWVGLLIALGATFLAGPGMALIFGPAFESSGGALAILIWIIPVALLSGHYRFTLLAYSHQKWLMICSGLAAMFSAGLCVVLIPRFGPQGAASALLAALTFELLLTRYAVHRIIHSIPLARAIAPSLAAAAVSVALREGILFAGNWWAAAAALSLYLALGIIGNRSRLQVFAGFLQQRYAPAGVSQRWKALSPLQRVLTQEVEP